MDYQKSDDEKYDYSERPDLVSEYASSDDVEPKVLGGPLTLPGVILDRTNAHLSRLL
jgi:hypothetical protein